MTVTAVPTWSLKGDWFDVCTCNIACPCVFAQAPTGNHCEGVLAYRINEGTFGDTDLVRSQRPGGRPLHRRPVGGRDHRDRRPDGRRPRKRGPAGRDPGHLRRGGRRVAGDVRSADRRLPRRGGRADPDGGRRRPLLVERRGPGQAHRLGRRADRPHCGPGEARTDDQPTGLRGRARRARRRHVGASARWPSPNRPCSATSICTRPRPPASTSRSTGPARTPEWACEHTRRHADARPHRRRPGGPPTPRRCWGRLVAPGHRDADVACSRGHPARARRSHGRRLGVGAPRRRRAQRDTDDGARRSAVPRGVDRHDDGDDVPSRHTDDPDLRQDRGHQAHLGAGFVPTWLFVGGYLLVWTALGAVAFTAALGAEALARHFDVLARTPPSSAVR